MMQITAEISTLSRAQRNSLAAFILDYPTHEVEPEGEDEDLVVIPAFAAADIDADLPASPDEAFAAAVPPPPGPQLVPPPPPAAVSAPSVDKAGLPWDERIHASSRTVTADGCWRKKRGVSDGLVSEVEAQLRSLMAIPAPPAVPVPPPPPSPTVAVAEPIPATAAPIPSAPADGKTAYVQLISKASAAIVAKQITQEQVNAAVIAAGVPSLPLLANRLDLVPQVTATIETLIAANAAA